MCLFSSLTRSYSFAPSKNSNTLSAQFLGHSSRAKNAALLCAEELLLGLMLKKPRDKLLFSLFKFPVLKKRLVRIRPSAKFTLSPFGSSFHKLLAANWTDGPG